MPLPPRMQQTKREALRRRSRKSSQENSNAAAIRALNRKVTEVVYHLQSVRELATSRLTEVSTLLEPLKTEVGELGRSRRGQRQELDELRTAMGRAGDQLKLLEPKVELLLAQGGGRPVVEAGRLAAVESGLRETQVRMAAMESWSRDVKAAVEADAKEVLRRVDVMSDAISGLATYVRKVEDNAKRAALAIDGSSHV